MLVALLLRQVCGHQMIFLAAVRWCVPLCGGFTGLEVFFPYEFIYKEQYTYMKELKVRDFRQWHG
jgi:hypothetical protein